MATGEHEWPGRIFEALRGQHVRQVAYVPDAGHKTLIDLCTGESTMVMVPLTTEEEGIALLAGAWLGGQRGVLLMQSSGVGNCMTMLSLARTCRFPLVMLVTMRGEAGEFNPWQVPMGRTAAPVLELAGCEVSVLGDAERAGEIVAASASRAFETSAMTAVLIAQRLVGVKTFDR